MNYVNATRVELLNKENYDTWKIQMEALLVKLDLWSAVDGSSPKPSSTSENDKEIEMWIKRDGKARSEIILSICSSELKQIKGCATARDIWDKLEGIYQRFGAKPSNGDSCLYQIGKGQESILIVVYVDDILIASRNLEDIKGLIRKLSSIFDVKDIGEVGYCLGIEFQRTAKEIKLHQRGFICDLLDRFGMCDANPVSTPMDCNTKLQKNVNPVSVEETKLPYRELIGALNYLSMATRPDISYTVSYLSQFNNCYSKTHWIAAKRVLRYLKGSMNLGIIFRCGSEDGPTGYVDADWGGCPDDRRSYTGFTFMLSGGPISWESKKQKTVALSSTEAEYMGMTEALKEGIYLRKMFLELGLNDLSKMKMFNDNLSAIKLSENPTFHARSKHIDIRYHFIREALKNGIISIGHISTENMLSDILTKRLPRNKHEDCVTMMGMKSYDKDYSATRGEVLESG